MRYQSVTHFNDTFVLCHVIGQQNETDLKCFFAHYSVGYPNGGRRNDSVFNPVFKRNDNTMSILETF